MTGKKKTFGYYYEEGRGSSGARFFKELCAGLTQYSVPYTQRPSVVLFNMSAPISKMILSRIRGQIVVLRVDGLWFDRISPAFLEAIPKFVRPLVVFLLNFKKIHIFLTDILNFLFDNYKSFIKITIADKVIYQSNFSKNIHNRIFPKKNSCVILNAFNYKDNNFKVFYNQGNTIKICIIYSNAPTKGIYESILFVKWLNEKNIKSEIHLFGYSGILPPNAPKDMHRLITESPEIIYYPVFSFFTEEMINWIQKCHFYLCLSRRDPCPNSVIEAMSYGLPVVGLRSGGVTEIVDTAGVLIDYEDWTDGLFHPQRYEFDCINIDYDILLGAILEVLGDLISYKERVKQRFHIDIGMNIAVNRYKTFLENVC